MFLAEFYCKKCDKIFEDLVASSSTPDTECLECQTVSEKVMSAARVGLYTDSKSEVTNNALKKRSFDHSVRSAKKDPEAFAAKTGNKPIAQSKWNIRNNKKK